MKQIKSFLISLIDNNNPNSSKVFSGLISLATIICASITDIIIHRGNITEFIWNGLLLYSAGCFGISMVDKMLNKTDTIVEDSKQIDNPDDGTK